MPKKKYIFLKRIISKKSKAGITLIALVVTIIVLLILAGISISMLSGDNGVLTRAGEAKNKNTEGIEKEQLQLATLASLGTDGTLNIEILKNNITKDVTGAIHDNAISFPLTVTYTATRNVYEIDSEGNVEKIVLGPTVSHTISPTEEGEHDEVTITLTVIPYEGTTIKSITAPSGVTETGDKIYKVTANGIYTFVVEGSNGGKTSHTVEIKNSKDVEKFSTIKELANRQYTDSETNTAWVPKGFYVGVSDSINKISKGLVITDSINADGTSNGNEFVWIPVDVTNVDNFIRYEGYLNKALQSYLSVTSEPCKNNAGYSTEASESSTMKTQVVGKGGFYVARFEISKNPTTNKAESKKGADPWVSIKWGDSMSSIGTTGAVYQSQQMYTDTIKYGVTSTLIYGSQWDAVMAWIDQSYKTGTCADTSYVKDSTGKGYYGKSNRTITGSDKAFAVNNLYDLAGNVWEWTMEAYNTNSRVYRGGSYLGTGPERPASRRSYYYPTGRLNDIGFRIALYLNN